MVPSECGLKFCDYLVNGNEIATSLPPGLTFRLLARVPNISITERLLLDNIHDNQSGEIVIGILLANYPSHRITEGPLLAAASYKAPRMMAILLPADKTITITAAVVSAAVSNTCCGDRLISILQSRHPKITNAVALLTAAVSNTRCGVSLMNTLFTTYPDVSIRNLTVGDQCNQDFQDVINQGHKHEGHRHGCDSGGGKWVLYQRRAGGAFGPNLGYQSHQGPRGGDRFRLDSGIDTLATFLTRVSMLNVSREAVILPVHGLHRQQSTRWLFSAEALEVSLSKPIQARDQHNGSREGPLLAALAYWNNEVMAMLLDREPSITISDEDWLAAAENCGGKVLGMLLVQGQNLAITEDLLLSVARYNTVSVMEMVLVKDLSTRITEEHLLAAARNKNWGVPLTEFLLARGPNITITEGL